MRGSHLSKFSLVLLIHSHQPVGNFDAVIEQTYQRSYLPFVERLLRHPGVRLGLHYTGPLLEWMERCHPEFFDHLRELTSRGQVELVGGGFYEPILVSIPPEDQLRQIQLMRDYLLEKFGREPDGAWLAERVWEPQAPYALASAGVKYTLVDDVHFLAAGFELDQLHGDYVCEDRGQTVRVFPGLKILRYLLPFRPREEAIAFLRESAQRHPGGMAAMGDDCEKFGAWPGTYDLNYRDGWLDGFFEALENSADWLATTPPGEYIREHRPLGRADLPTASYSEMMEWALPTKARNAYHQVSQEFANRPDVLRFLRGGPWRAFFTKYAESNLLHKKMLRVSAKQHSFDSKRMSPERSAKHHCAEKHLLRAQCNDAYWHGVFGGVYAPHLRTELWRELVRAETLLDELARRADGLHDRTNRFRWRRLRRALRHFQKPHGAGAACRRRHSGGPRLPAQRGHAHQLHAAPARGLSQPASATPRPLLPAAKSSPFTIRCAARKRAWNAICVTIAGPEMPSGFCSFRPARPSTITRS